MNACITSSPITYPTLRQCSASSAVFDWGQLVIEVQHNTHFQRGVYYDGPDDDGIGALCSITRVTVYDDNGDSLVVPVDDVLMAWMEGRIEKWVEG